MLTKQGELINLLLRNGYIDENYLDYISIFYEGSLSKGRLSISNKCKDPKTICI